ncbi:MAG: hypothetical protein Q9170_007418 [Blastenia crenularia]
MVQYTKDADSIDNSGNLLLLRKDLHFTLDRLEWTIFPPASNWVIYALDPSPEVASQFHLRHLRPIEGVDSAYLFAAFARAIFPYLNRFLRNRIGKYLIRTEVDPHQAEGAKSSGHPSKKGGPSTPAGSTTRTAVAGLEEPQDSGALSSSLSRAANDRQSSGNYQHRPHAFRNPALDGPCTCETLPPSPSSSDSGRDSPPVALKTFNRCLSDHCRTIQDLVRLNGIREEKLAIERARSDSKGSWERELAWAKDPAAVGDVNRWFWVKGFEVLDDNGDYLEKHDTDKEYLDTPEKLGNTVAIT